MKKAILVFSVLLLIVLSGCSENHKSDKELAENYVMTQGYEIVSDGSTIESYVLDRSKMHEIQYNQIWSVQETAPDKYFGEEISTFCFVVNNHPLKKLYNLDTNVYIMISDNKIIGGYSFPSKDTYILYGSVYSLGGKTSEEITGLSFYEWLNNWASK